VFRNHRLGDEAAARHCRLHIEHEHPRVGAPSHLRWASTADNKLAYHAFL